MAEYDEQGKKLSIKLVYYGPALSGKTTNLMRLHDSITDLHKGELMVLETKDDRTLFFDLLPLGFHAPSGLLVKFKLFTVPGQVAHDSTRKAVLSRADGVIFVADSQKTQSKNNAESFNNLSENCAKVGIDFTAMPLIVQFNKRDMRNIVGEQEVLDKWARTQWDVYFSNALKPNAGVEATFIGLLEKVYKKLDVEYKLTTVHGLTEVTFTHAVIGVDSVGVANGP